MNEHVDYDAKKSDSVKRFLWWCAGADKRILTYSSYSDHVKYVGIGGVVLATGFMAALSMGFAMHTIFSDVDPSTGERVGNWFITIPIALIWALIVFNLDRFIVSSTGKGDGEARISGSEWGSAVPRLIMAILLGLTISAPLETYIFQKEIQREWNDTKKELAQKRIFETKYQMQTSGSVLKAKEQFKLDSTRLAEKDNEFKAKKIIIENILSGLNGYAKCDRGEFCPTHREYYKQRDQANLERDEAEKTFLASKMNVINAEQSDIKVLEDEAKKIEAMDAGFLDQIMMLEKLSSQEKEIPQYDPVTLKPLEDKPKTVVYASAGAPIWLVRFLFMIIEILPVILKLMLVKSPYNYMEENVNQILEAKQGISLEHIPDQNDKINKLKVNFNPKRIISIVEHQNKKEEENAKEAITQFAEKERQEIIKDPESFIKPDEPTE
jgi:hypothetical protein